MKRNVMRRNETERKGKETRQDKTREEIDGERERIKAKRRRKCITTVVLIIASSAFLVRGYWFASKLTRLPAG